MTSMVKEGTGGKMRASLDYRDRFLCVLIENGEPKKWFPVRRRTTPKPKCCSADRSRASINRREFTWTRKETSINWRTKARRSQSGSSLSRRGRKPSWRSFGRLSELGHLSHYLEKIRHGTVKVIAKFGDVSKVHSARA